MDRGRGILREAREASIQKLRNFCRFFFHFFFDDLSSKSFPFRLYNQDLDTEVQNFTENSIDFNEAIPGRNDSPEGFNQISRSTADSGISSDTNSVKTLFKPTAGLGIGRLGLSAGPISQNIKNVEKFKISIQNIKKLIRQPGNNHVLKSRIKREMGVFKCDIVMERKLIEATIALACEFKRNVIIDYFMNLIRIYEERDKLRFNEFLLFIFLWPGIKAKTKVNVKISIPKYFLD